MANARGSKDYLNLLKGLNTEANPLAFPEGYSSDELNFLLSLGGNVRSRRKGLQKKLETDLNYTSSTGLDYVSNLNFHYWKEADLILLVLDDGVNNRLVVLENDVSFTELGSYTIGTVSSGNTIKPSFSPILEGVVITSSDAGTGEATPTIFVTLDTEGNISINEIELYFRDFELLDDDTSISFRPNSLTDTHTYNLLNAGWYAERKNPSGNLVDPLSLFTSSTVYETSNETIADSLENQFVFNTSTPSSLAELGGGDVIDVSGMTDPTNNGTFTVVSVSLTIQDSPPPDTSFIYEYTVKVIEAITVDETVTSNVGINFTKGSFPSNADIPSLGLKTDESSGEQYFDPNTLYEVVLGNTEAPRGHYIYDISGSKTRESVISNKANDGSPPTTVTLKAVITR